MGFKSSLPPSSFPPRPPSTFKSVCLGYSVYREDEKGMEGGVCGVGMQFIVGRKSLEGGQPSQSYTNPSSPSTPDSDSTSETNPTSTSSRTTATNSSSPNATQPTSFNLNISTLSSTAKRHSNFAQKIVTEVRDTVQDNYLKRCEEFGGKVVSRIPKTAQDVWKFASGQGKM